MQYRYRTSLDSNQKTCPFICLFIPLVCSNYALVHPLVGHKLPLVGNKGFSLIELIITLTIAGILLSLAVPAMTTFVANQRLTSQANDLIADFTFARSEAIRIGATTSTRQVVICKTTNPTTASPVCDTTVANAWTPGRLIFIDANNNSQLDNGETLLRVRQQLDGASSNNNRLLGEGTATDTANRIVFSDNGATSLNTEKQLLLCDNRGGAQALAVVINPLGRARVAAKGKDRNGGNIACP